MSKSARIRFQYPGSDMGWWTGMIILMLPLGLWVMSQNGTEWYLVAAAGLSVPAIGVWFRIRLAGHMFLVLHSFFGVLGTVALLFWMPFSWMRLLRIVLAFSTAHAALRWTRRILVEDEMADRGVPQDQIREIMRAREKFGS